MAKNYYLVHYGTKGQKWGQRNYQNPDGSYTAKGQSENYGHGRYSSVARNKLKLTNEQKKYIKIGLAITASALAAYGGYKLYNNIPPYYKNLGKKNVDFIRNSGKFDYLSENPIFGNSESITGKIGKKSSELDLNMISTINEKNRGTVEGSINCFHTSCAYILNSLFGYNVVAKGFNGIDEVSGISNTGGRPGALLHSIFNGIDEKHINGSSFTEGLNNIPIRSTGIIGLFDSNTGFGHMLNYEKDSTGLITLIDCQADMVFNINSNNLSAINAFFKSDFFLYDFSNASIKDNVDDILKNIVE